jgi:hypothetical protein
MGTISKTPQRTLESEPFTSIDGNQDLDYMSRYPKLTYPNCIVQRQRQDRYQRCSRKSRSQEIPQFCFVSSMPSVLGDAVSISIESEHILSKIQPDLPDELQAEIRLFTLSASACANLQSCCRKEHFESLVRTEGLNPATPHAASETRAALGIPPLYSQTQQAYSISPPIGRMLEQDSSIFVCRN